MKLVTFTVVRDEDALLAANLKYHLSIGFDRFYVLFHRSDSGFSRRLRDSFAAGRLFVFHEPSKEFHQRRYQEFLLRQIAANDADSWVFPLDADEFIHVDRDIKEYLGNLEGRGIGYACFKLFDMLHDLERQASLKNPLSSVHGYFPFKERDWEQPSSLFKSFCRMHASIRVFDGGHFFSSVPMEPFPIPVDEGLIFHYSNKGNPEGLLRKWRNLALSRLEQRSPVPQVWWEKYDLMAERIRRYQSDPELLEAEWFREPRTFWGTPIPRHKIIRDERMRNKLALLESEEWDETGAFYC